MESKMQLICALLPPTNSNREYSTLTRHGLWFALLVCLVPVLSAHGKGQTMSTYAGLNTVQDHMNSTATPDPTIAVGLTDYCEHVNSGYQCWYKSGANANQPVEFFGNTNVKSDAQPWSQNSNNSGHTPNCPTAYSPNSEMVHDNVYNVWILEKRISSTINGHNYMCVAISNIDDFSQSSFAWFAFEYDLDTVIPTNSHGNYYYPDYPQVGLWQTSTSTTPPYTAATDQALWITYDLQDINNADNIMGVLLCAVDLAGLRNSTASPWVNNSKTPACVVAHPLVTYTQRRSWVPANNSDTIPPIAADGEMFTYMIEPPKDNKSYLTDPIHTQGVEQWTINWSSSTPTPSEVNSWDLPSTQAGGDQLGCFIANNYYDTVCIPQPSTASTGIYIDSVADRMQQFFHYTSNGGQGSNWTSGHAIQIVPSNSVLSQTEADIRVLQRNTMTPNSIYVAADYPIVDPSDSNAYTYLPSVVRDKAGNLQGILGISGTGVDEHPGLDSLNLNPSTLQATSYGYIASPINDGDAEDKDSLNYRWGDWYSGVLDPSDGCTVWVAGEYLPVNRTSEPNWYTELATLPPASTCAGGPVLLSNVSLNFGNQTVGVKSSALVETVTNNQSVNLNILAVSAGNGFQQTNNCNQPLQTHQSCTISVYFTPSAAGLQTETLTITDDAPNSPQTVALAGIGASSAVMLSPNTLAFGNQVVNTNSAGQKVTMSNTGFVNVTINSIQASGGFAETDNCTGMTLTPGQTCTITGGFTPVVTGATTGTITVNDTAVGSPHLISLTGTGVVPVQLSTIANFPAQNVGTSSPAETLTLTNNQNSTLTYTMTISGDYSAVGNGSTPCNGTLAAKAKCTYGVTFTPTTNGVIKGALTVTYSGSGSPASSGLSGTGQDGPTAPLTFSPASLSFGNVVLQTTVSKSVTVKNISAGAITFTSITGSGAFTATPSGSSPCSGTLNAGAQCSMTVKFTPLATGGLVGGITIVDNASVSTQVQNAAGTGILAVSLSPASINFGTVAVGSTSTVQVVTVTNHETSPVPIDSVVASGDFIYTSGGGVPCGASIPANSICTLGVQFAPSVTGGISGDLTLTYSAASSPQVVSLSGTGQ